jgi:oligopeptide/dipeptide ABC transporter ATP-binding protein
MGQGIILKACNLCKYFYEHRRGLLSGQTVIKAVHQVNLEVKEQEIAAIIGESGCGKTTLGLTLARVYNPTAGEIWFNGEDISRLRETELKRIRREMQMVFQDPGSSLNPRHKIENIVSLPLRIHLNLSKAELRRRVSELLELVNLPPDMMLRNPTDLSGGEKQRVGIARALALNPKIVILDEPTSALDVSVQAKILQLLEKLQQDLKLTYLIITHNLILAKNLTNQVIVMYLGKVIEMAKTSVIFQHPIHPYTKALLSSIPVIKEEERRMLPKEVILEGDIPSLANPLETCPFLSRCKEKEKFCETMPCPDLKEVEQGHFVRCYLPQVHSYPRNV